MTTNPQAQPPVWTVESLIGKAIHAETTNQYRLAGHYINRAREILRDQRVRNYADHLALELAEQIRLNFERSRADRQAELSLAAALADEDFWSAAGILEGQDYDLGGDLSGGLRYVQHAGATPVVLYPNPDHFPGGM